MNELISIVVPIYNVEDYLKRCVDSIINQTYSNIEIILVDDGGKDKCGAMCDEYENIDDRIKVIHKPNGGLSDARNKGIDIANGEYIAFVDSDDYIAVDFIETLYKLCKENDSDISQCGFEKVYGDEFVENVQDNNPVTRSNIQQLEYAYSKDEVESIVVWNKLYKRVLFNEIRFPFGKINEDEFTTYKLFYKANKVTTIGRKLYGYFMSDNSIMRSSYNLKRLHYIEAVEERMEFFKKIDNKLLIESTEQNLNFALIDNYSKCKKYFPESKDVLNDLKVKYKNSCTRLNNLESTTSVQKLKNKIKKNSLDLQVKIRGNHE